ncbi:DUF1642 domain-containing protein [Streptococcus suis]|uniref:DUF1642 domain-containing protein n=1 Tax=Streptococcus suis TaxID=1307 RepID=UPI002AB4ABBC|nr:DUF1642 domain-containing protein [Streptococcus suis]MDY7603047.1 DUF1642 domain-containing protein [Streptococcus suis]
MLVKQVYRFPKQHEPQKVVIPKFVADWLKESRHADTLLKVLNAAEDERVVPSAVNDWILNNQRDFVVAWYDGYEIEQEKLYVVTDGNKLYLKEFNELNAIIIIDDVVGAVDYAKRYEDKTKAQQAADELGWIVKEVE